MRDFESFARRVGAIDFPASPELVRQYVADLGGRAKIATIRRHLAAISRRHRDANLDSPTRTILVRNQVEGVERHHVEVGKRVDKKSALTSDMLKVALRQCDAGPKGVRDRAIMLLGFAGAFRRSEIAGLDVEDLVFDARGMLVTLRRSKTDQRGEGRSIGLPALRSTMCPVAAIRSWLKISGIVRGPLFVGFSLDGTMTRMRISGQLVERLVLSLTAKANLVGDFGAHSLRAGFVTSAAERHVDQHVIAKTTGHKSQKILAGYIRSATLFDDSPLALIMRKRA